MSKAKAIACALLAAAFYAVNVPLSKLLLNHVGPTTMASLLYLGAGIGIGLLPRATNNWRWKVKLGKEFYIDDEDEYVPEPGDLIFFHFDRADEEPNFPNHVGIVVDYDEEQDLVYTVEGNAAAANSDLVMYNVMSAFYVACSSFISQNFGAGKRVQKRPPSSSSAEGEISPS